MSNNSIISQESLAIIRATSPVVKENAEAITTVFYPKMLGRNPDLFRYFNESNQLKGTQAKAFSRMLSGELDDVTTPPQASTKPSAAPPPSSQQAKTLADAVVSYAMNIEKLENLSDAVVRICNKHCALGIQPEDYQIVHDNLMEAIGEVLGEAVTPQVAAAWSEAVMALAKILIKTEEQMYNQAAQDQWTGPREFVVDAIIEETPDIKSFRLVAKDGKGPCPYEPAQYISIYEKPPEKTYFAPRHYTLTSQSGTDPYYQVSIKKLGAHDKDDHPGVMSHYMHSKKVGDSVQLGPVFGPPPLKQGSVDRMACFVSVGVGITPTVAMLPTAIKERSRGIAVFHADKSSRTFAFQNYLIETIEKHDGAIMNITFSSDKTKTTTNAGALSKYVSEGRLTPEKIIQTLESSSSDVKYKNGEVDFFICAGTASSPIIYNGLKVAGVPPECLHLEFFGPFQNIPEEDD